MSKIPLIENNVAKTNAEVNKIGTSNSGNATYAKVDKAIKVHAETASNDAKNLIVKKI